MEQANDVKQELYIEMSCKRMAAVEDIPGQHGDVGFLSSTQNDDSSSVDIRIG